MLENLGLEAQTEAVYRLMLEDPFRGISELASALNVPEGEICDALDTLADLSLVRSSGDTSGSLMPVSPQVGLEALVTSRQAIITREQQAMDECRAAAARFVAEYNSSSTTGAYGKVERLIGVNAVRLRLEELALGAQSETCGFAPGGKQSASNMESSRPLTERLLNSGVVVRTVYQDSVRNDARSREHVSWLTARGGEVRTAPTLPLRMQVVDRRVAVLPLDPEDSSRGAIVLGDAGAVCAAYALFEAVWEKAQPLQGSTEDPTRELSAREVAVLEMLSQGMTDEAIARKLSVSLRTERRIISELMEYFDARNRFQLGQRAAEGFGLPVS